MVVVVGYVGVVVILYGGYCVDCVVVVIDYYMFVGVIVGLVGGCFKF